MDWVWEKLFPGPKDPLEAFVATFKGPIKREEIQFSKKSANYIGKDEQYQFGKTIRLISGEPLKVHPLDYYCDVEAGNDPGNVRFLELPSSLFFQARFGNRAAFVQNETLHVLTLNPTRYRRGKWSSFDDRLRNAALEAKDSEAVFRYSKDATEDSYLWHRGVPNIYLSSTTKRLVLGTPGTLPLNFNELKPLPSHTNARVLRCTNNHKGIYLMLEACGKPAIDVLLDGNKLMVFIDHSVQHGELINRCGYELPELRTYVVFSVVLACNEKVIDQQNLLASLDNAGCLHITIPILNRPDRPPSQPDTRQE
jgi:hypothetical protein